MKKGLSLLLAVIILSISSWAQGPRYQRLPGFGYWQDRGAYDSALHIPSFSTTPSLNGSPFTSRPAISFKMGDSTGLWLYYPTTGSWHRIGDGGAGTVYSDSTFSRNDSLFYSRGGSEYYIKRVQPFGSYLSASDTSDKWINDISRRGDSVFKKIGSVWSFAFLDSLGAGGGGGGSGTVSNSANANRLTYYSASGTTVGPLAAITASRALVSDANGLPVASSVTDTELGYVSGVTSSIQTQLNAKLSSVDTTNIPSFSVKTRSLFSGTSPILYNSATGGFSLDTTTSAGGWHSRSYNDLRYYPLSGNPSGFLSSIDTGNITGFAAKVRSLHSATAFLVYNSATGNFSIDTASGKVRSENYYNTKFASAVGGLTPLFSSSLTAGSISYTLSNASPYTVFGRGSGSGSPSYLGSLDSNWIPSLHSSGYYDLRYLTSIPSFQQTTDVNRKTTDTISAGGYRGNYIRSDTSSNSPYEIIVFPDLQNMTYGYQAIGRGMFNKVRDSVSAWNVKAVLQVGDLAQTPTTAEMDTISNQFGVLDAINLPYIAVPGNHDYNGQAPAARDLTIYNTYFGPSRFAGKSFYGGHFGTDNANYWIHFTAGSKKYVVIGLEFLPRDTVLTWAGNILDSFIAADPTREAIIITHAYQSAYGELSTDSTTWTNNTYGMDATSNNGVDMWNKLIRKKRNIRWVFNGHYLIVPGSGPADGYTDKMESIGDYGNVINQIFVNFQNDNNGGNGYFMRLQFKPSTGKVDVKFYSSYYNAYDTVNASYTLDAPPIQIEGSAGYSGSVSVNRDLRVQGEIKADSLSAQRLVFTGPDHKLSVSDSIIYNPYATYKLDYFGTSRFTGNITQLGWIDAQLGEDNVVIGRHPGGMKLGTAGATSRRNLFLGLNAGDSMYNGGNGSVGLGFGALGMANAGRQTATGYETLKRFVGTTQTYGNSGYGIWNLEYLHHGQGNVSSGHDGGKVGYSDYGIYLGVDNAGNGSSTDSLLNTIVIGSFSQTTGATRRRLTVIGLSTSATCDTCFIIDPGQRVGLGTLDPSRSAKLEVTSTTQGVLLPRMTSTQRTAITPETGLLLFDTDSSSYFQYTGSAWQKLTGVSSGGSGSISNLGSGYKLVIGGNTVRSFVNIWGTYFDTTSTTIGIGIDTSDGNLNVATQGDIDRAIAGVSGGGLTVGSSSITGGSSGNVLYHNGGVLGEMTTSGSGTVLALTNSPVFTTPNLGTPSAVVLTNATGTASSLTSGKANNLTGGNGTTLLGSIPYQSGTDVTTMLSPNTTATKKFLTQTGTGTNGAAPGWNSILDGDLPSALTGKTYNGLTLTANAAGFQIAGGTSSKTLTVNNSIALTGTDGTTMTFPSTSATIARTDAGQTFTGTNIFSSTITGSISGNAATVTTNANLSGDVTSSGNTTTYNNVLPSTKGGAGTVSGILKANGSGVVSAATAGTDYQGALTLTTTGSSGAATLIGNTLNIPQYTGGGGATLDFNDNHFDSTSTSIISLDTVNGPMSSATGNGYLKAIDYKRSFTAQTVSNPTGTWTYDVNAGGQADVSLTATGGRTLAFSNVRTGDIVLMRFNNTSGSEITLTLPSNSFLDGASASTATIPTGRSQISLSGYDGTNSLFSSSSGSFATASNNLSFFSATTTKQFTGVISVDTIGTIPPVQYSVVASDFTLSAALGVQSAFPSTQDVYTLQGSTTYEVEGHYFMTTGTTTTKTTAIAFALAGGATVTTINLHVLGSNNTANTTATAQGSLPMTQVASTVVTATATTAGVDIFFRGIIITNARGTWTPQINFSANPGGTNLMKAGSYIKFTKLGTSSQAQIGNVN